MSRDYARRHRGHKVLALAVVAAAACIVHVAAGAEDVLPALCAAGQVPSILGERGSCTPCPPGAISAAGDSVCSPCGGKHETANKARTACECVHGYTRRSSGGPCVPQPLAAASPPCATGMLRLSMRTGTHGAGVALGDDPAGEDPCVCEGNAQFAGKSSEACEACPTGRVSYDGRQCRCPVDHEDTGKDGCSPCSGGGVAPLRAQGVCVCPFGTYGNPRLGGCQACPGHLPESLPPGQNMHLESCRCPAGSVPSAGEIPCVPCPDGFLHTRGPEIDLCVRA